VKTGAGIPPRVRLLAAAESLFAAGTFSGARIDAIAKAAGVNKRLIYHYFGDKARLYREILRRAHRRWTAFEYFKDAPQDPLEFIDGFVVWLFHKYRGDPHFVRLVVGENIHEGKYFDIASPSPATRLLLTTFREVVQRGKIQGQIREGVSMIHLLMDIMALCFFNFSNAYTISPTLETDVRDPAFLGERLAHIRSVVRRSIVRSHERPRVSPDGRSDTPGRARSRRRVARSAEPVLPEGRT
jgi:AcrR family transcriptional regulator